MKSKIFRVSGGSATAVASGELTPAVEAYTRVLARRCLEMHGRSASDIGVAGLLARSFEKNIAPEQLSGELARSSTCIVCTLYMYLYKHVRMFSRMSAVISIRPYYVFIRSASYARYVFFSRRAGGYCEFCTFTFFLLQKIKIPS